MNDFVENAATGTAKTLPAGKAGSNAGAERISAAIRAARYRPHPRAAFIPFVTAGDPNLSATESIVRELARVGADVIEIGVPFSDPVAEGPTIQASSARGLASGTTLEAILQMVERLADLSAPVVLMTYLNPVHHFGYDRFFAQAARAGVSGVIIPDLPYEERSEIVTPAAAAGVAIIPLVAPTSAGRIGMIAAKAEGFVYVVSSLGVTGARAKITGDLSAVLDPIRQATTVPAAIGFGVSTAEQAESLGAIADGVIVGSALVEIIGEQGANAPQSVGRFAAQLIAGLEKAG